MGQPCEFQVKPRLQGPTGSDGHRWALIDASSGSDEPNRATPGRAGVTKFSTFRFGDWE
jgi:hypothetical protein